MQDDPVMRTVFMGTPDFAVPALQALDKISNLIAVYTRQDAVSNRGKTPTPSSVKSAALKLGLEVFTPQTLRDPSVVEQLKALAPDVIIVAAYGMILPKEILEIPAYGCINLHASILPYYRGAAPIQRAILAGEAEAGVAVMRMEEGLDTGPYSLVGKVEIGEKNTLHLTAELAELAGELTAETISMLEHGHLTWTAQDDELATYAPKITKADVSLHSSLTTQEFTRRVRASSPSAPARLALAGHGATVLEATAYHDDSEQPHTAKPGEILVTKREVILGTVDGSVLLGAIKPDGKKEMNARDFVRGARIESGAKWE